MVLFGFMGAGKTAVGRVAARRLGFSFLDMDEEIEQRAGRSIASLFEQQGETAFRSMERELVAELAEARGRVIATGGGVVLDPRNIALFEAHGVLACLRAEPATVLARTASQTHRPLLQTPDKESRIRELLRRRAPWYDALPHQIRTDGRTVDDVAEELISLYRQQTARAPDNRAR